ncbi:MAG TPA: rRNA maturation RNase YbeY [Pyrinomonadaceae bacterium]|nr:rRNA maturation RNase YbeY [Pyrinomonadaceae bacterium]
MVEVVNRQRTCKVPSHKWTELGKNILNQIGRGGSSATIAFVSDRKSRELNRTFRGIDKPTDVLSFPSGDGGPDLGDIAVSIETAKIQARQNGLSLEREIAQLILHGLLHLCGYDHETDKGEMNRLELQLRRRLKI